MKSNSRAGKASAASVEPVLHIVRFGPFPFQNQVGLADGVGLRVNLLAVQVNGDVLALLGGQLRQRILRHGEHTARAAGSVIDQVGARPHRVGHRQED